MFFTIETPDARPRDSLLAVAHSTPVRSGVTLRQHIALTDRDVEILSWVTRHGMVVAEQVCRRFFGTMPVAWRRLRLLEEAGMLRRDAAWLGMPRVIRATYRGTRLADADLGPPPLDYIGLRHQLAVVDLSEELLSEHAGAAWETERELRRDRTRAARDDPVALVGRIPDGVLVVAGGQRIAVELDLTPKRTRLLESVIPALALNREVSTVLWYAPSETAAARIAEVARSCGLDHLIAARVRRVARR